MFFVSKLESRFKMFELTSEIIEKEYIIEKYKEIIKEVRELLNQEWYTVLRKETIKKARQILDTEIK